MTTAASAVKANGVFARFFQRVAALSQSFEFWAKSGPIADNGCDGDG